MFKEILSPNFVFLLKERKLTELDKLAFVSLVTNFGDKDKYNFYFVHCVYIPILNVIAFIIFELFTIMSWKCRHYSPEPRYPTANPETWIRVIILTVYLRIKFLKS